VGVREVALGGGEHLGLHGGGGGGGGGGGALSLSEGLVVWCVPNPCPTMTPDLLL